MPRITAEPSKNEPRIVAWGRLAYAEALARQLDLWAQRLAGRIPDMIAVVEHEPVVTLGRHAPEDDVLLDLAALEARGVAVARSDRGGRATYHGPGQAVIYPIVGVLERGLGVKEWVAMLEGALADTLASYRITGRTIDGRPGIWVGEAKIASLGLRIARGVSYHGVSINVERRSVEGFEHIVTCGIAAQRVTSVADELKTGPDDLATNEASVELAAARFCRALIRRLSAHGQSGRT